MLKAKIFADKLDHAVYIVLLLSLFLVFWNPVALMMNLTGDNPVIALVWRAITSFICWLVILLCLLCSVRSRSLILSSFMTLSLWVRWLIVIFFFIGLLSAINAYSPSLAFKGLSIDMTMLLSVLFLAGYWQGNKRRIDWLIMVIIICAVGYLLVLLYMLYFAKALDWEQNYQSLLLVRYNFANPRFFDHFSSWFLPLLCLPLLSKKYTKMIKVLAFLAMISLWFMVIAHSSRAFILEYIVIVCVLGVLNFRFLWPFLGYQCIAVIIAAFLFWFINLSLETTSIMSRDLLANNDRWLLWSKSLWLASHHLRLGIGELNAIYYLQDYPHNVLLSVLLQWGVIAFVIFLLIGIRSFQYACIAMKAYRDSALYFVAFTSVLAGMTHAMVSNLFKMPLSQFSLVFAMGLLLCFMPLSKTITLKRYMHYLLLILILSLIVLLCVLVYFFSVMI
ncbi:O-antigen ligase family protein [Facilibium subflavum]|uniref:O-antigen ligase family protein n=1 Tax=Facilibium subflavum TaxID=2219058 RepID=UPI000E652FA6|nr:O-antigen ligase family protein [Facilibium subflavum]